VPAADVFGAKRVERSRSEGGLEVTVEKRPVQFVGPWRQGSPVGATPSGQPPLGVLSEKDVAPGRVDRGDVCGPGLDVAFECFGVLGPTETALHAAFPGPPVHVVARFAIRQTIFLNRRHHLSFAVILVNGSGTAGAKAAKSVDRIVGE